MLDTILFLSGIAGIAIIVFYYSFKFLHKFLPVTVKRFFDKLYKRMNNNKIFIWFVENNIAPIFLAICLALFGWHYYIS
jgi:fatty acid desaturase